MAFQTKCSCLGSGWFGLKADPEELRQSSCCEAVAFSVEKKDKSLTCYPITDFCSPMVTVYFVSIYSSVNKKYNASIFHRCSMQS